MIRNNGNVACVSEFYAEKLGWISNTEPGQLIPNVDKHALIDHENINFITVKYEDIPRLHKHAGLDILSLIPLLHIHEKIHDI